MTSAVSKLSKYAEDVKKSPGNTIFPQAAAAIFYKNDIDALAKQLAEAKNYNTFMDIDSKISKFSTQFPANFEPLVRLQREEASSLFTYANKLMEIRSFVRAKALVKRGNAILKKLQNSAQL
jgi:hypothetical protein